MLAGGYAPEVLVRGGSSILAPEWGLGVADPAADQCIERAALIAAHQRRIDAIGRSEWRARLAPIDRSRIAVLRGEDEVHLTVDAFGAALAFMLRRTAEGSWQVVEESTPSMYERP